MGRGGGRYGCPAPPAPCSTVALYLGGPEGDSDAAARDQLTTTPFTLPFGGRSRPPRSGASCVTTSRVASESEDCGPSMQPRFCGTRLRAPPHLSCAHTVAAVLQPPGYPRDLCNGYTEGYCRPRSQRPREINRRGPSPILSSPSCDSHASPLSWAIPSPQPDPACGLRAPRRIRALLGRIRTPPTSERRSLIVEQAYARPRLSSKRSRGELVYTTSRHAFEGSGRGQPAAARVCYSRRMDV